MTRPEPRRSDRDEESLGIRDVWDALDRARVNAAPRTLAAAQDAIFQLYLPMARTLAHSVDTGDRLVEPSAAEKAAELGLAQAVLGWRSPDGTGFELFATIAVAAQLDRLPTVQPRTPPGAS